MQVDATFAEASYSAASTVVLISIILSGIIIGLGRAFSSRKLSSFGFEELFQSIINGALVGAAFSITTVLDSLAKDAVPSSPLFSTCSGESVPSLVLCGLEKVFEASSSAFQSSVLAGNIIGFASKLSLDFGTLSAQPFFSLESASNAMGAGQFSLLVIMAAINLQSLAIQFLSQYAIPLLFPLGIVFRSFFPTRRLGGALLGLAIGAYIFLPLSIYLPLSSESDAWEKFEGFSSTLLSFRQDFGAFASMNLADEENVREQITNLQERNFLERISEVLVKYSEAVSFLLMQNVFLPLLGLIITGVAVIQLAKVLGGEFSGFDFGAI